MAADGSRQAAQAASDLSFYGRLVAEHFQAAWGNLEVRHL